MPFFKSESPIESEEYKQANIKAMDYVKNPSKLGILLNDVKTKSTETFFFRSCNDMYRLMMAYYKKDYTQIPLKSLTAIIAAFIYFVMPIDFIPDTLIGIGLLDDAFILKWTLKFVQKDIDDFLEWEKDKNQSCVISMDN